MLARAMPEAPGFDLAGDVTVRVSDQHADWRHRDLSVALVEQDLGVAKYAAWVPVTRNLLEDSADLWAVIDRGVDRALRPWRYPDRPAWPTFQTVPALAHAQEVVESVAGEVVRRARAAWAVLRWGVGERDDEWGDEG